MSAPTTNDNSQIKAPVFVKLTNQPLLKGNFESAITIQNPANIVEEFKQHEIFTRGYQSMVNPEIQEEVEEIIIPHVVERVFAVAVPAPIPPPRIIEYSEVSEGGEVNLDPHIIELEKKLHADGSRPRRNSQQAGYIDDNIRPELAAQLSQTHDQDQVEIQYKDVERIEYIDEIIEIPTKIQQDKVICNIITQEKKVPVVSIEYVEKKVTKEIPVIRFIEKEVVKKRLVPTRKPKEVPTIEGTADQVVPVTQKVDYLVDTNPDIEANVEYEIEEVLFDRVIECIKPVIKHKFTPLEPYEEDGGEVVVVVPKGFNIETDRAEGDGFNIYKTYGGVDTETRHHAVAPEGHEMIYKVASGKSVVNQSLMQQASAYNVNNGAPAASMFSRTNIDYSGAVGQLRQSMIEEEADKKSRVTAQLKGGLSAPNVGGLNMNNNASAITRSRIMDTDLRSRHTTVGATQAIPAVHLEGTSHAYTQFVVPMASQIASLHTAYLPAKYAHNVRISAPEIAHAVTEDNKTYQIYSKHGAAHLPTQPAVGQFNPVNFEHHLMGHGEMVENQRYPAAPVASLYNYPQQYQYQQYQQQQ
eukprot:GDKK01029270.1.p1 GENE.GDKK01029270.1~~GDKK01029270.1.p1  ORF type:complete len:583 (-),score=202.85 GDKK01029270.1:436-2184(-)